MLPYQEQYIRNVVEIASIWQFAASRSDGFREWYAERLRSGGRMLYPTLDTLHEAGPEVIRDLEEFAEKLMDWRTNLDCGVYVTIHDALLSLCRVRKDRDGVIRELYKLGMGLYI